MASPRMLVIRREQLRILEESMLKRFEDEMVMHLAAFSPPLYRVLKHDRMREVVRFGIRHAHNYGFRLRGPIRLYLELMLLFGSHFDTDPQYPWATEILADDLSVSEMQRAEWLFERTLDYQDKVSGPGGVNTSNALKRLRLIGRAPLDISPIDFEDSIRQELFRAFPQKADFIGNESLTTLIRSGRDEAHAYGFPSPRGETLVVVLKFAFGHGCADDPIYPWIGRTLTDGKIVDAAARAARLERKALTWLEHVLRGSGEEDRT